MVSEAGQLVKKGEEILSQWIYISGDRNNDAINLFTKAANLYKMEKELDKAGEVYEKIITLLYKTDQKFDVNFF
jgi:hypothetical protein